MLDWLKNRRARPTPGPAPDAQRAAELVRNGDALLALGDLDGAQACCRQALALDPRNADVQHLLGSLAERRQDWEAAAHHHQAAFDLKPELKLACRDACRALLLLGKTSSARTLLATGLATHPDFADLHFYEGNILLAENDAEWALESYQKALALGADHAALHGRMGAALLQRSSLEKAHAHLQRAIELEPGYMQAHHDLGVVLHHLGRIEEAIQQQQITIAHEPHQLGAHSCLLFSLCFSPTCTPTQYRARARHFAEQARKDVTPLLAAPVTRQPGATVGQRRLRIGWVSGDLRRHVNMAFFKEMLKHLTSQPLDLIAFSNNPLDDSVTEQLRAMMTEWHDIMALSDHDAAMLIRECRIDVLIDLAGHTAHNRLPVFAWRPAPVQASWLGFAASTGLTEMDYLLADPVSVPQKSRGQYSERIMYLPETRLCMRPPGSADKWPISPLPAQLQGHITFGCFQQLAKINARVLVAWRKILAGVPGSRLRLQIRYLDLPSVREDLERRLRASGIPSASVRLHEGTQFDSYLAAHHDVDIVLDTFPYPGGTTTAEALWMGVPTITLQGESLLARQGASMLSCVGLNEWIASDQADYVKRAVRLATDIPALAQLRQQLRAQALASPLFDSERFARHLVAAFHAMHQDTAKGLPPG